jgi:hypothetical protein
MAEYSRLASGSVLSAGGQTLVALPFIPNFIEITNSTEITAASGGVTRAWWMTDMGQGAAAYVTTGAGPADGSHFISAATGGGFSTFSAGLALQYGANFLLGASGGIAKTSATILTVTTTAAHGLVSGNVVIFNNLYETATTGMQQIAGIPFVVTVTGTTTFTIPWVGNSSNLTAITAGGLNTLAAFKQVLYPALYAPGVFYPWSITTGTTTTVYTTAPHNLQVGQEIGFRIPSAYGMTQLNELPNVVTPGKPMYHYVTSVVSSTEFICSAISTGFTAFNVNQPFLSFPGLQFAQGVAVGDVNTGGFAYTGAQLYPSPTVYNGYSTTAVNTINGPAIQGAFFNATFMGFIIGATIAGSASDQLYWRAYMHDVNY